MFCVVKYPDNNDCLHGHFRVLKGGFKTATQANKWCKKNLPRDTVHFYHQVPPPFGKCKYAVSNWKPS